jgi:Reverse transcriptase (RNA-dependent DNA polymerase)
VIATTSTPIGYDLEFCVDTGSAMSLISKDTLRQFFPSAIVESLSRIDITGIGSGGNTASEYATIPLELTSLRKETVNLLAEVHVVEELSCSLLIGMNVLKANHVDLRLSKDYMGVESHKIPIRTKPVKKRKRIPVYFAGSTPVAIPAGHSITVPIKHRKTGSLSDSFHILEPEATADLSIGIFASAPRAIITPHQNIPYSNLGESPITLRPGKRIGTLVVNPLANLPRASIPVLLTTLKEDTEDIDPLPFQAGYNEDDPADVDISNADVSDEFGPEYKSKIVTILEKHKALFRNELGMFNDDTRMPIRLKDEKDISGLKSAPFHMSERDKREADIILDPMLEQGRIEKVPLGEPTPISAPGFVVWRKGKPRFVVDLRKLNLKLLPDAYPLPRQDDVLSAVGGAMIFSSMDIQKGFFQQRIRDEDKWKTTFVTAHRGQERLTVSTMGLATSPAFFQHRMESLLAKYLWKTVLVYIDDIIVYSRTLEGHLTDLSETLRVLHASGITLSLKKCHFGYRSIEALGHRVGRLGLATHEDKIEAISKLDYPVTFQQLEAGIGMFGFYRKYVRGFSVMVEPLESLKTTLLKSAPKKGRKRRNFGSNTSLQLNDAHRLAWDELKKALAEAPILALPDFSKPFILGWPRVESKSLVLGIE